MTAIEWTDETWNPTTGCDRISPGCDNCYALTMAKRLQAMGQPKYANDGDPRTSGSGFAFTQHEDSLDAPLRWHRPRKVFVNSMSDLFHKDASDAFIGGVWATMRDAPQHTYQILTKRPQRMASFTRRLRTIDAGSFFLSDLAGSQFVLPNVWLGTSIENDHYTFRADHLRNTPAAVRFLSLEPLLGPLPSLDLTGIDWVIAGGESGPNARPMHPKWVEHIRDRCIAAGVPFLFKQWGAWSPIARTRPDGTYDVFGKGFAIVLSDGQHFDTWDDWKQAAGQDHRLTRLSPTAMYLHGKKAAGRELDGRTWDEYPPALPEDGDK